MKTCTKCGLTKPFSDFHHKTKTRFQTACKECKKIYQRQHYKENADSYLKNKQDRITIVKNFINQSKNKPCLDCGNRFPPVCMDFDHLLNKTFNISNCARLTTNLDRIKLEMDKCEVVCANCHRLRTQDRLGRPGNDPGSPS